MFELYEYIYLTGLIGKTAPSVRRLAPEFSTRSCQVLQACALCLLLLSSILSGRAFAASIDIATPNLAGVYGGGTTTITGTGFAGMTDVYFGNVRIDPANWTLLTSSKLLVTIPPSENLAEGNVDVTIWHGSTKITMRKGFVYARIDPTITDIQPRQVGYLGGDTVTITGSDFSLTQSVTFNGVAAASFEVSKDNQSLKVKVPPSAGATSGPVAVSVHTSFGIGSSSDLLSFYQKLPTITAVNATSAGVNGGSVVTITGTDLTNTIGVKFGTVSADPNTITQVSATEISVTVPPSGGLTASTVDLTVITSRGSATRSAFFRYTVSNPVVSGITANTSPAFGGITVTITGNAFYKTIGILFGDVPADMSTLVIGNSSYMKVKVPPSPNLAQGSVDVTVITQTGRATLVKGFTYTRQDPVVTGISPNRGPVYGGYSFVVSGVGLADATSVQLGNNTYTKTRDGYGNFFSVNSDNSLKVTLGIGNVSNTYAGATNLIVTTPTGATTLWRGFTFDARSDPVITKVTPPFSMDTGGTFVTIDGSNFDNLQSVRFAGAWGEIQSFTSTQIKVKTPQRAAGIMGMTVQTARGYTTISNTFEVLTSPPNPVTYTFIDVPAPTAASTNGTTKFTIWGTNLTGASVTVGGVSAKIDNSSLSFVTGNFPVQSPGVKPILVTTPGGSASPSQMPTVTYQAQPAPTVTGASVASGSVVGGTQMVITGTNLQGATVTFDGLPATIVDNPADGLSVTVSTPLHAAPGNVPVVITTPAAVPVLLAGGFTYELPPPPTVTDFAPTSVPGTGGSVITVKGTYLKGSTVTVDGTPVNTVQIISDNLLTFAAPPHVPGTVPVRIGNPAGFVDKQLTYAVPPYFVDSATPGTDSILGGATITMTGFNLFGASVFFDSVPATDVVIADDGKSLTVTAPPHVAGPATIWIYNPADGYVGLPDAFTYYTPMRTVTAISTPNGSGNTYGGTKFSLTGTNLWNATVLFDATEATNVVVAADGLSLTGVVPAHAAGPVVVTLKTPGGTVTLPDPFNYVIPLPELWSKDMVEGTTDGGTTVVVSGRYLNGATVTFDGVPATDISISSGGYSVTSRSPPHTPGPVTMVVTTPGGSTPMLESFTYVAPSPILTSVSPATGLTAGGSTITLNGKYLWDAQVFLGSLAATSVKVAPDGQSLTAVVPARREGAVDVIVSVAGKTDAVLANGFSYVPQAPTLTGIEPNRGPLVGGTQIKLTGTDITPTSTVNFGSQVINPTTISLDGLSLVFTLPASSSPVSLPVTVTTSGGTSGTMTFTYVPKPILTGTSAAIGPLTGGPVTLTGTHFISGAKVNFNGQTITPDTIDSTGNGLTFTAPAATATGTVSYTVTTAGGTTTALSYTYMPKPVIGSINPSAASLAGGTVTLSGTGFLAGTKVNFNGSVITPDTIENTGNLLTFTAPAVTAAARVSLTVSNAGGTSNAVDYVYVSQPRIDSLSVTSGPETSGQSVRITGANLADVSSVKFGNAAATITGATATTLDVTAPAGTGSVSVVAAGIGGTSNALAYTYVPPPVISSISPASGSFAGGTVTVNGSNFCGCGKVNFNGQAIVPDTVNASGTSLTFIAPPATTAGPVSVTVTATGGTSNAATYTYVAGPVLTGLSATRGPLAAGQSIVITGANLSGVTGVTFGTASATIVSVTATTITVTAPAGQGTVGVVATTIGGPSNALNYTFVPPPVISGLSPAMGPLIGQSVTVSGTDFVAGTTVNIDGQDITPDTIDSSGASLTFTTPAVSAPGTARVTISTVGGTSAAVDYAYLARPVISSLTPTSGPLAGGTVTVSGSGFLPGTMVNFNGQVITPDTIDSAETSLTFTAPAATTPGDVSFTLTAPGGSSNAATYTYLAPPVLTSLDVSSGPETAGQVVKITGTNLASVTSVKFGTASATITRVTATLIEVTAPAGTGSVSVTVIGGGGISNGLAYRFVPLPTLTGINPAIGPMGGNMQVTLTGTNFTADSTVRFGSRVLTPDSVAANGLSLIVTTPSATAAGPVPVTVTAIGGTTAASFSYRYADAPVITGLSVDGGPLSGGTALDIIGSHFSGSVAVTIGGTPVTGISVSGTEDRIHLITPAGTAGKAVVAVAAAGGTTTSPADFTYLKVPTIGSLSVSRGPETAGQTVTITGTDLSAVTAVRFGTASATITTATATTVSVTAPAGHGTVGVTLETPGGTSNAVNYTYVPAPVISSFSPGIGPLSGMSVRVNGSDFVAGTRVTFDGQNISPDQLDSSGTWLTFTAPSVPSAKTASFTVTTVGGTSAAESYAYVDRPVISSVTPQSGPLAGGTVSVSGSGFLPGTTVNFNGQVITPSLGSGGNSLTFTAPSATTAGAVSFTVTAVGGTSNAATYTYVAAPVLTSLNVTRGSEAAGQAVTLTGTELTGVTSVKFGTASATITRVTATAVDVTAPAGRGTVDVTVTTIGGASNALSYTYVPVPVISSLDSLSGPLAGASITVYGSDFVAGALVTFNGQDIVPASIDTAGRSLKFTAPSVATPAAVSLTVKTIGGTSNAVNYSYVNGPGIANITPSAGPLGGGSVTVTGSGFSPETIVTFDGRSMTPTSINGSGTSLTFIAPPVTAAAVVSLTVSNSGGRSNAVDYTYAGQPHIGSLSVASGPETAGQRITISGTDLSTVTSVTFGSVSGTVIRATATTVDVTVPAGHGTVGVTVTSVGGTSNAVNYTYVPVPVISSFSPSMGPLSGGSVRVNGSDFVAGTRVTLDGQHIVPDTLDSAGTWLTFTLPSVTTARSVSFTVETIGGISAAERFVYVDKPVISSVTPAEGPLGGGIVSVSGSGFLPGTMVDFNGRTITPSLGSDGTSLTFTVPSVATPGTVSYTVTAAGGTSNAATYTYVDAPSISSLSQTMGPETGGQVLHITGTGLARVTDVRFGTIAATFSNAAANGVDVIVPAGTGTVGVTVSHVGGTSNAVDFTYVPLPIISRLSSFSGPLVGGSITVHGANFGSGTGVVFDGQLKTPTSIDPAGTWLKFTADPVATPRAVLLTVTTPGGASNAVTYSYVNGPGISLITPSAGPLGGGSVTITGSGFLPDTMVNFDGQVITPTTINSAGTSLTFVAPSVTAAAIVPLTISNTGGTSNAVDYTYVGQPHIDSLSVTRGPETSGQTVTIIGTDLATVTGVTFGTVSATINSVTASTVTVTAPAGRGTVGVTVESVGGTSNAVSYTHVPVPVISSFSPSMGPLSGGSVRVNGSDFVAGTKVTFDGQDIPVDQLDSAGTWLTFTAPSVPSAKTVSFIVTTVGGTSGAQDYDYIDKPVISSITPASASLAGGSVTMSGSGFLPDTTVNFGGQVITPDSIGSGGNALTFTAPSATAGASVSVSVSNIGGRSNGVTFTYLGQPQITSLSVTSGPETAGQSVTIRGTDLAGVTSVHFGTSAATINSVTATTVNVTAPAGTGSVSVTVASPGGTSNGISYTYLPVPTLTALNPAIGPTTGNTVVTLTGSDFTAGSIVHFGNRDVAGGTVGSGGTSLTVTSPPATAAGTVPVHVTTEGGSTSTSSFRYVDAPVISGLSAKAGPLAGGTVLEIVGSNFSGAVSVSIGGTSVSGISVAGDESSIRLTTPPGTAGNAVVTVTAAGGMATSPDDFVYLDAPSVSALSRATGPEAGGQSVRINGSNLGAVTRVLFGTAQATIDAVNSSSVDVTTPAGSGSVTVTVESAGGSDRSATYLYVPVPVISSLDKTSGASSGGEPLRISGSDLTNVLSVDFNGRIAPITSNTSATVDVVTPPGTGTVNVRVTTHGGTSQPLSFTYLNVPRIANLDLTIGPEAGGQRVHLAGSDLGGITGVQFGTNPATIVPGSVSPTGVDVIAPAGTGTVAVTATTPGGTSNGVNYTYAPVPSVASIDVTSGPLGGGTRVTVTGSGFVTGAKVLLGSQSLTPDSIAAGGTSLIFTMPLASAPGPVTIAVETVGGVSASTATFTYLDGPVLSQVNPSAGPSLGGQTVRLTGTGLQAVTQVSFGAGSAAIVPGSATSTTLDVVTPPGRGTVAVTAASRGGTSNSIVYTYADGPQISTISPRAGPVAGGFEVMIGGSSLGSPQSVTVDGTPVTPSAIATDGSWIKVMMPPHAAGRVAIAVQTVGGAANLTSAFEYVDVPAISGMSPAEGPVAGGNVSEITGQNFTPDMEVLVDGVTAPVSQFVDTSHVKVIVPAHASGQGSVAVTVKTPGGEAHLANGYTYADAMSATPLSGALPEGLPGEVYEQAIRVVNGKAPYAFALTAGALPDGLSLDASSGLISGTIATTGSGQASFTVTVTDQAGHALDLAYSIAIGTLEFTIPERVVSFAESEAAGGIELTEGVNGGPFVSAIVVSVDPPAAGTAVITPGGASGQPGSPSRSAGPAMMSRAAAASVPSAASAVTYASFKLNFTVTPGYHGQAAVRYQLETRSGRVGKGLITYTFGLDPIIVGSSASREAQRFVDHRRSMLLPALNTPSLLDRGNQPLEKTGRMRMDPSASGLRMGFDVTQPLSLGSDGEASPATFWARVSTELFQRSGEDATGKPSDWGTFAMLSTGIDYRVSDRLLVGLTLDYHRMSDPMEADALVTGTGWLAGPYASVRLLENVYLDATLLYGQTSNGLRGSLSLGHFASSMLLARTSLRGEFDLQGISVSPSLTMDYFNEEVESFEVTSTDGQVITVPGFHRREMRTSIGIDFTKSYMLQGGIMVTPQFGVATGFSGLDGTGLFGSVTAGVQVATPAGWNFQSGVKAQLAAEGKSMGVDSSVSKRF